jgi:hypothetical protein
MINFELKLPATKNKTRDQIAMDWMIDKARREAVRKPNAVPPKTKTIQKFKKGGKPRQENALERINRIKYEFGETKEKPAHLDNKNIYSFEEQEIFRNNINNPKRVQKARDPSILEKSTPVDIDYDLGPRTAFIGLWPTIKDSTLYKLLENPKAVGVELGHEGILETMNLIQKLALKKGGRVK